MVKPTVPTADEAAKKWADVTPGRATYYATNAPAAADKQNANAIAAATTFRTAISGADMASKFIGGLKKAGSAKYRRKVTDVGAARFGPGVQAAQGDMSTGVAPFLDEIGKTDLANRGPRGDPANYSRVSKIGDALHKKRLAVLGSTT
jgi:hypothetical protein